MTTKRTGCLFRRSESVPGTHLRNLRNACNSSFTKYNTSSLHGRAGPKGMCLRELALSLAWGRQSQWPRLTIQTNRTFCLVQELCSMNTAIVSLHPHEPLPYGCLPGPTDLACLPPLPSTCLSIDMTFAFTVLCTPIANLILCQFQGLPDLTFQSSPLPKSPALDSLLPQPINTLL